MLAFSCKQNESVSEPKSVGPVQWLTFDGAPDRPSIVLVSGDEEYRSEEALPQLARILSEHHGFNCTVLFAQDPEFPGIVDPNYTRNIPGLEHLSDADGMVIFTRFRALPDDQMELIDDYLMQGKPVVGIRTSTHAFHFTKEDSLSGYRHYGNFNQEEGPWKDGFGRLVLGEKWISHHGRHKLQSTRGKINSQAINHPIVQGINDGEIWGATDVYGVRLPLAEDGKALILGQVVNAELPYDNEDLFYGLRESDRKLAGIDTARVNLGDLNDPMMPIAWTKTYQLPGGQRGKAFTSTIGASTDLLNESVRRLLVNAVFWSLDMDVPAFANVDVVGAYNPTQFKFESDEYWEERNLVIKDQ